MCVRSAYLWEYEKGNMGEMKKGGKAVRAQIVIIFYAVGIMR